MQEALLSNLGLTSGEVKIYLSLLHLGQTTTGPIISHAQISSSKVYEILERLAKKGLVSHIIKNNTKYFQATSPKKLKTYLAKKKVKIDKQEQELEQALPALMQAYNAKALEQGAQLFIGAKAMKTMLYDVVAESQKNDEFCFFAGQGEEYEKASAQFYTAYDAHRHQLGLKVRGIAAPSQKKYFTEANRNMRYAAFATPSNMAVFQNKLMIISWAAQPIAVLITSQPIVDQFKRFFEDAWKLAKK